MFECFHLQCGTWFRRVGRVLGVPGLVVLAFGCGTAPGSGDDDDVVPQYIDGVLDARVDYPAAPAVGLQAEILFTEVPAHAEIFRCRIFTYEGPDVGVDKMWTYHNPTYSHHTILKTSHPDDVQYEDGEVFDCGAEDEQKQRPVLFEGIALASPNNSGSDISLPEGWAFQLRSGQRWIIEGHYINVTAEPAIVNNAVNLGFLPDEEVEEYVAAWTHDAGQFEIPPGDGVEIRFDCVCDAPSTVVSVTGHMHERGVSYAIDWNHAEGTERIYEEPDWNPVWRYEPDIQNWPMGEEVISPGDSFTHTCVWDNDSGGTLSFPQEMCTAFGVVRGYTDPIHCVPQHSDESEER
ncbi:MAG: hypothetical protein VX498_14340 [Myxococcota bacterium]|nr:hypothetical protein [Myxococcota bacterium]